jgi:hypothetical protein
MLIIFPYFLAVHSINNIILGINLHIANGRKIKIIAKIILDTFGFPQAIFVIEFKNNGAIIIKIKTAKIEKLKIEPKLV